MSQPVSGPRRTQPTYSTPTPVAPVQGPAPTVEPLGDFTTVLGKYRNALLDAKVKGDPSAEAQAVTLKAWLDAQLQTTQRQVDTTRSTIQSFVDEYAGSTSDIEQVRKKFQEVRDRGPVLQDVYETDKKMSKEVSYNFAPLYSKSALIVGLAVVAGLVWRRI